MISYVAAAVGDGLTKEILSKELEWDQGSSLVGWINFDLPKFSIWQVEICLFYSMV
jgi:hypothetical protein